MRSIFSYLLLIFILIYFAFLILNPSIHFSLSSTKTSALQAVGLGVILGFALILCFIQDAPLSSMLIILFLTAFNGMFFSILDQLWGGLAEGQLLDLLSGNGQAYLAGLSGLLVYSGLLGRKSLLFILLVDIIHMLFYSLNFQLVNLLNAQDSGYSLRVFMMSSTESLLISCIDRNCEQRVPSASHMGYALMGGTILWVSFPALNCLGLDEEMTLRKAMGYINTVIVLSSSTLALVASNYIFRGKIESTSFVFGSIIGGVTAGGFATLSLTPALSLPIGLFSGLMASLIYLWNPLKHFTTPTFKLQEPLFVSSLIGTITSISLLAFYHDNDGLPQQNELTTQQSAPAKFYALCITLAAGLFAGLLSLILSGMLKNLGRDEEQGGEQDSNEGEPLEMKDWVLLKQES